MRRVVSWWAVVCGAVTMLPSYPRQRRQRRAATGPISLNGINTPDFHSVASTSLCQHHAKVLTLVALLHIQIMLGNVTLNLNISATIRPSLRPVP